VCGFPDLISIPVSTDSLGAFPHSNMYYFSKTYRFVQLPAALDHFVISHTPGDFGCMVFSSRKYSTFRVICCWSPLLQLKRRDLISAVNPELFLMQAVSALITPIGYV
jgi:hypothetical protein